MQSIINNESNISAAVHLNTPEIFGLIGQYANNYDLLKLNFVCKAGHTACTEQIKDRKYESTHTKRCLGTGNKAVNYVGVNGFTRSDYKLTGQLTLTDSDNNKKIAYIIQHKTNMAVIIDGIAYGCEVITSQAFVASTINDNHDGDITTIYSYNRGKVNVFEGSYEKKWLKNRTDVIMTDEVTGAKTTCDSSLFLDFNYPEYQDIVILDTRTKTVYNKYFDKLYTYVKQSL